MPGRVITGDALTVLRELPSESVHCCVTSPPYWSQRDYGTRQWFDADPACDHDQNIAHGPIHPGQVPQTMSKREKVVLSGEAATTVDLNRTKSVAMGQTATTYSCSKCNGWYGQLGLEPVPFKSEYSGPGYVEHMVEVFRELRRVLHTSGTFWLNIGDTYATPTAAKRQPALKAKDLVGVPWRLAFAMQEDGWYLRNDCVWMKVPARPESVRDRATRNHEYIFMFSKAESYYYDKTGSYERDKAQEQGRYSVWTLPPTAYEGNHFAAFDSSLPAIAIQLGTSAHGCCETCKSPFKRDAGSWVATCACDGANVIPCTVLDPFSGTGTTTSAAIKLQRDAIGIENNPDYVALSERPLAEARALANGDDLFDFVMD